MQGVPQRRGSTLISRTRTFACASGFGCRFLSRNIRTEGVVEGAEEEGIQISVAPIDASRETLRYAYTMLTSEGSDSAKDVDELQRLLGSAARDCVAKERNSFVEFQANTGVEVCTFRLLVNNAASLLGDKDPIKLEAEVKLDDVVRSFTLLYNVANQANIQLSSDRLQVANAVMDTISSLDKFEQGIKACLEI